MTTPFNRPFSTGRELQYIAEALVTNHHLSGDGPFTKKCQALLEGSTGSHKVLLTHSCTAALEMAAILCEVASGDEVIMPSYTFVSTANAFVLRGATPVFVDIRADTLNMDETLVEAAITPRTRAIVAVHYAGVACELDTLAEISSRNGLRLVEDAAQGVHARYKGRSLGSIGALGTLSFHETKNVISGEGGALLVNDPALVDRSEIIWEKGTNRKQFFRGLVDKYSWVDVGSSFLPSEMVAAFLYAQLGDAEAITRRRLELWERYHEAFAPLEEEGVLRRPVIPDYCEHNAHMYYLLLPDGETRTQVLGALRAGGIDAVFHYVPLHEAPAGRRFGRTHGELRHTSDLWQRLIRLPLWVGMDDHLQEVVEHVYRALGQRPPL